MYRTYIFISSYFIHSRDTWRTMVAGNVSFSRLKKNESLENLDEFHGSQLRNRDTILLGRATFEIGIFASCIALSTIVTLVREKFCRGSVGY